MECYIDEEEIWKCRTHPSKRRRTGICPICLRDRLNTLCPNCAKLGPCECFPDVAAAASSTSPFSSVAASGDGEPSMRRSRSLAIPFLRSRSKYAPNLEFIDQKHPLPEPQRPASDRKPPLPQPPAIETSTGSNRGKKSSSLLSIFKSSKSKKLGEILEKEKEKEESSNDFASMMKRSRSVSALFSSKSRAADDKSAPAKARWHFPSPMYAFRQLKTSKVLEEQRSAMCKV